MREFKYTVTQKDADERREIRQIIRSEFHLSHRLRSRIKREHLVFLNGKPAEGYYVPSRGDEISVHLPDEHSNFEPEDIPLDIIYEDNDLLVINKPPHLVVHPTHGFPNHTVANAVTKYMNDTGEIFKIRFINRLDMDTSGLLVLGKNANSQDRYMKDQERGLIGKEYEAIVRGIIEDDEGVIDAPIGKPDPAKAQRGVVSGGKAAVTHFKVIERYPSGFTRVNLKLETGRTHQIRVHMLYIGHVIVGDEFYGGEALGLIDRQALHARALSFDHPITKERLELEAPLPADMLSLISKISR